MSNNHNSKVENLEALISRIAFEIVNEGILDKNDIDKILGILTNNGVYAMWVWAKAEKNIDEEKLFSKLLGLMEKVKEKNENNSEEYFQNISDNLHKLLFLKQLLEKTLIYARYHARAMGED